MDKTAIVVVHYQNQKDTFSCLQSLSKTLISNSSYNLILVDNSANISFTKSLKKHFPSLISIDNKSNQGFAQGNNLGIKKALRNGCKNIIILNNDTIISSNLISGLVSFANTDRLIGLVSPKIYFAKGYEYHKNRYSDKEKGKVIWYAGGKIDWANFYASHIGVDQVDDGSFDQISETDFCTGCCLLVKEEIVRNVGLLDEKYFLYFEDVDYSLRVKQAGYKVIYYPKVFLWHKNASTSGRPGSPTHIYYQNRNRLFFGFKYSDSWWNKKSLVIDSIKLMLKGGVTSRAIIDYYLGRMGKANI